MGYPDKWSTFPPTELFKPKKYKPGAVAIEIGAQSRSMKLSSNIKW